MAATAGPAAATAVRGDGVTGLDDGSFDVAGVTAGGSCGGAVPALAVLGIGDMDAGANRGDDIGDDLKKAADLCLETSPDPDPDGETIDVPCSIKSAMMFSSSSLSRSPVSTAEAEGALPPPLHAADGLRDTTTAE